MGLGTWRNAMKKFFFLSLALILSLSAYAREVTVGVFVHASYNFV